FHLYKRIANVSAIEVGGHGTVTRNQVHVAVLIESRRAAAHPYSGSLLAITVGRRRRSPDRTPDRGILNVIGKHPPMIDIKTDIAMRTERHINVVVRQNK